MKHSTLPSPATVELVWKTLPYLQRVGLKDGAANRPSYFCFRSSISSSAVNGLTMLSLPFDLQESAGKFRSAFGKANQYHTHNMPWVDRPNVINNYFGYMVSG
jgi:hypothetical protein